MAAPTHYEVLGVSPAASAEEIKKSFHDLARKHHPDVSPGKNSEDLFRRINAAYQVLSDANKRALYDSELKLLAFRASRAQPQPSSSARPSPQSKPQPASQGRSNSSQGQTTRAAQKPSPVDTLLAQATTAFRKMRYREAEMLCRQILRMDRRNVLAFEILGDVHKARGRTDEAIAMYSYVLQLDRANASVRSKFDRLVGNPSGPTMSGHAASASRRSHTRGNRSESLVQSIPVRAALSLGGAALLATVIILTVDSSLEPPKSFNPLEWDIRLIGCIAAAGGISGALFSLNGFLAGFREEMSVAHKASRKAPVPLGIVLVGFAALSFYASLLVYIVICAARRSTSRSISLAYGVSLVLMVILALLLRPFSLHMLVMGGNALFLSFMVGWWAGDSALSA